MIESNARSHRTRGAARNLSAAWCVRLL